MSGVCKYCKVCYGGLQQHQKTCGEKKSYEDAKQRSHEFALAKLKIEADLEKHRINFELEKFRIANLYNSICKCQYEVETDLKFKRVFEVALMCPSNTNPGIVISDLRDMINKIPTLAGFYKEYSQKISFSDNMYQKLYEKYEDSPAETLIRKQQKLGVLCCDIKADMFID